MTNERNAELIRTAFGAVRAPFAIADMQIVRFRGERSRARIVPQTAMGLLDTLSAKVAPVPAPAPRTSKPAAAPAPEPAPEPSAEPDAKVSEPVTEEREEQLVADRKTRERKATRSNKSVSSMARDLAAAEAVADAHEQHARESEGATEPPADVEELTARDFGKPGSS